MSDPVITFGPLTFDPAIGVLRGNGAEARLGQRAAALLQALIDADNQPVTKSALLDAAWPGMVVEEGNLTVQIAALRKALGPRPDGLEWIVTVPRVGYRLVKAESADAARPASLPIVGVGRFANFSAAIEQDYFADGIVDDIATALSRFRSLVVITRRGREPVADTPAHLRQIADETGACYLVSGSVRRAGERLRITAQLVECASGAHLWGQNFDGTIADIFDFQDAITESVATHVEPNIRAAEIERARRERPQSLASYDIYLQALAKILSESEPDNAEACRLLTVALEIEPDNGVLLAHAAWTLEHRITMGWPPLGPDDREKCGDLARRGLDHAHGNPQVMTHCGMALLQGSRDYEAGMAAVLAAVAANPNNLMSVTAAGVACLHCGSLDDALGHFRRADRLNPLDPFAHIWLCGIADVQIILGNYAEALDWAARAYALSTAFDPSLWMLIAANAHLGRLDAAKRFLAELQELVPGITIARIKAGQPAKDPARLAALLAGLRLAGMAEG